MKRALPSLSSILLLVLVASAYCGTLYSPPILDDYHSFIYQQNVYLKQWSVSSLAFLSQTVFGWARWIPMLSFAFDHWIGKGSIVAFHITNTLIHALCLLAVVFLIFNLLEIFGEKEPSSKGIPNSMFAIFVAGLWALHPVQTNAVTYLVQRMASLQALFFITAVACYIVGRRKHIQGGNLGKAIPFYVACVIASIGAFLSKENSLMLPVMILVTEVWFFSPNLHLSIWKRLVASRKVVWGVLLVFLLCMAFLSIKMGRDLTAGYAGRHFTMGERLLTEIRIVVWYMTLLLWPAPSRMSIEHDVLISTSLVNPPTTLLAAVLLLFLVWCTIRCRKQYPLITYGLAWLFLNLFIESSVVPLELVFEHRLYLPSVGFFLSLTCVLVHALRCLLAKQTARDFVIISYCVFALLISGLTLLTFTRNQAWTDSASIYQDAVLKAPNNPRAHANLAVACGMAGRYEQSISEAELAIGLGQQHHEQWAVAANAILGSLNGLGRYQGTVERGEQLLRYAPKNFNGNALPTLHSNLAEAYLRSGRIEEAYASLIKALQWTQQKGGDAIDFRIIEGMLVQILQESASRQVDLDQDGAPDPGELPIKTWTAKAFLEHGERGEAKKLLTQATAENPEDAEAARLLQSIMREDELNCVQLSKENTKEKYLHHPFSGFNGCMALAYLLRSSNMPSPLRNFGEKLVDHALAIQPWAADAHLLKAWYLYDRKEAEQAVSSAQQALTLDPDYAKAWLGLGFFLMESNQFAAAANAFNRALELYPGCPQRKTIIAIITGIEQNSSLPTALDPTSNLANRPFSRTPDRLSRSLPEPPTVDKMERLAIQGGSIPAKRPGADTVG